MHHDVIIVGGSYAGLSAALALGRARKRTLIIDAGQRRNRFAHESHGFLGQDGRDPAAIATTGRAEVATYPSVSFYDGTATAAASRDDGFAVTTDDGATHTASRLVLATGMVDALPDLPGLRAGWGNGIYACPYCHGYEVAGRRIGVLALLPLATHQANMLPDWGPTTFFTNEAVALSAEGRAALAARGVQVEDGAVATLTLHDGAFAGVWLADGRSFALDALFTGGPVRQASPLAAQLGCALDETPFGEFIRVDMFGQTSVPGIYAAGDACTPGPNIARAVASGYTTGAAVHQSLIPALPH